MATQTSGPVWIPISLDFDEANRKLEDFKKKLPGPIQGQVAPSSPFQKKTEEQQKLWGQLKRYYEMSNVERWDFRRAQAAEKQRIFDITHRPSGFGLQSWRDTLNQGGLAAVGKRVMSAAKVPAAVALGYGIVSGTIKLLPEAMGLGRQLGGEPLSQTSTAGGATVDQLQQVVESMRQTIVRLETQIATIFSSIAKTTELNTAALRLTGKLPNSEYYYRFFKEYDTNERLLQDRFDTWKTREAPFVMTQTFIDIFKRSILQ